MIIGESKGQSGQRRPQAVRSKALARHRARLTFEPVEPGFGRTLGAALEQVLQSSLRVSASAVDSARQDRLELDIQTDGSITPAEALRLSARLLRGQLEPFAMHEPDRQPESVANARAGRIRAHEWAGLLRSVSELNLSVRSSTGLRARNIGLLGDLIQRTESDLLRTPHLGRKSVHEIKGALAAWGLTLGTPVPGWTPPPD